MNLFFQMDENKINKLINVAKKYYFDGMTQNQIANELNLSRPMISKYIAEARELGIVTISIKSPLEGDNHVIDLLKERYGILGGGLIYPTGQPDTSEGLIASSVAQFLLDTLKHNSHVGIAWGNIISSVISVVEKQYKHSGITGEATSLIGNSNTANRNYHTDSLCGSFSSITGFSPNYIHAPAFVESQEDYDLIIRTDSYRKACNRWSKLDVAIFDIDNYPSVPDLATASRFGNTLSLRKAVGHMLAYYFDVNGDFIHEENGLVVQIPLDVLKKIRIRIGVCNGSLNANALRGALNTGLITHLFVNKITAEDAIRVNINNTKTGLTE
jgi:deoxyribonucleoside regulator